ncbi:FAD:protein FMN transferase [Kitasatospora nipponensis]|uniref:FAD:protein FMN transferase n=1 Tax=Kitasatospora nipponensis TaxID=258049 RepID=A0ABP4GCJ2_9ACTN
MLRHAEPVMGTVVSFAVPGADPARRAAVLGPAIAELHRLDALLSPYLPRSELSRLARGELTVDRCDPLVGEALGHCAALATETDGWFTARPGGRLDPSGWVKGWALERASDLLTHAGHRDHSVTGGGDVQARGPAASDPAADGPVVDGPTAGARAWRIGVADPHRAGQVLAVLTAPDGEPFAVATSGTAERGAHILDPHTGRPAEGLRSLTVVGRRIARTDAYATAAFAMGPHRALAWLEARPGYEGLAVLPDGRRLGTPGLRRYLAARG